MPHASSRTLIQPDTRSLRVFGCIWAVIFTVIGLWPLPAGEPRYWALFVATVFVVLTWMQPAFFARSGMYRGWVRLGEIVGIFNSRIIMVLMFFLIFAPFGLFFRLVGRDVLHRRPDPAASTYFVERTEQPGSMRNQF